MNYTPFSSFLLFNASQRLAILLLLLIVVSLQLLCVFVDFAPPPDNRSEEKQWLAQQSKLDSLKLAAARYQPKIYPFNPNFISDYKGYRLGMTTAQIDRLLAFRRQNLFVNSAEEFQKVTQVSDSLLAVISPYFKFPDWVRKKAFGKTYPNTPFNEKPKTKAPPRDINTANQEELMAVYGIGSALSERILKEREKLGGFLTLDQLDLIWGLKPEVVAKVRESFFVKTPPNVMKVAVNKASVKELAAVPYLNYYMAKSIVTYRSMHDGIHSIEELSKVENIPVEKIKIIALYLEF